MNLNPKNFFLCWILLLAYFSFLSNVVAQTISDSIIIENDDLRQELKNEAEQENSKISKEELLHLAVQFRSELNENQHAIGDWQVNNFPFESSNEFSLSYQEKHFLFNANQFFIDDVCVKFYIPADIFLSKEKEHWNLYSVDSDKIRIGFEFINEDGNKVRKVRSIESGSKIELK